MTAADKVRSSRIRQLEEEGFVVKLRPFQKLINRISIGPPWI